MSSVNEQIEDAPKVQPEVHPNSYVHKQKEHLRMPDVDKLHFDRVDRCEIQDIDPNADTCQTPASNVCHELGVVLCYGHVAAVEAIFAEQVAARQPIVEAVAKEDEHEEKRQEAPVPQKPIDLGSIIFGGQLKTDAGSSSASGSTDQN